VRGVKEGSRGGEGVQCRKERCVWIILCQPSLTCGLQHKISHLVTQSLEIVMISATGLSSPVGRSDIQRKTKNKGSSYISRSGSTGLLDRDQWGAGCLILTAFQTTGDPDGQLLKALQGMSTTGRWKKNIWNQTELVHYLL
jgi:hypothetical protein